MLELSMLELVFGSPWEAIEVVAVAVFFANLITVCLPNHSDNKLIQFGIDTLNTLSFNILRNANRLCPHRYPDPSAKPKKSRRSNKAVDKRLGGSDA